MATTDPKALFESDETAWLERPDRDVEGPWIERKEWCDVREIARQLSGFANGYKPGGLFVLGVDKTGKIIGLSSRMAAVNAHLAQLGDTIESCGWKERFVSVGNGADQVLYIFVPFSEKRVVCLANGSAYRRRGDATHELSHEEIEALRHERGEVHAEDEPAVEYSEIAVDPDLAQELLAALKRKNGLTMPLTLESALRNRQLIVETPRGLFLTVAGLLAVGNRPTDAIWGAHVRFQHFEGTEEKLGAERNVVKDVSFDGPIPKLVPAFRDFMRTQVREFDYLGTDGKFVNEPEYPEFAWVEAAVNAVVHRSYSLRNTPIFVSMFDDRLEVVSPGGFPVAFPTPIRAETLWSNPRNPHLCSALRDFELVRLAQEGTRRMEKEMKDLGLPLPALEELPGPRVRVTLRNDLQRRRGRVGAGEAKRAWDEVARLLREDLAIYRRKALQHWANLRAKGAMPPAAVFDAAITAIQTAGIQEDEALEIFRRVEADADGGLAKPLATDLLAGHFAARGQLQWRVAHFVARSDEALELILSWLEQSTPERGSLVDAALTTFFDRVQAEPLPPRQWIDRVIAICGKFAPVSEQAKQVYSLITGRSLP